MRMYVNDENGGIIGASNNMSTVIDTHIDSSTSDVGDEETKASYYEGRIQ
jgi:hypothetical protein